jgi:hypothetical protein
LEEARQLNELLIRWLPLQLNAMLDAAHPEFSEATELCCALMEVQLLGGQALVALLEADSVRMELLQAVALPLSQLLPDPGEYLLWRFRQNNRAAGRPQCSPPSHLCLPQHWCPTSGQQRC